MGSTTTDSVGGYEIVLDDHCALAEDSCVVSLNVRAKTDNSHVQALSFSDLTATGDSLVLEADFDRLQ